MLLELPSNVQAAVIALVVALVGVLIRYLSLYLPWLGEFLERYKEEWGTALGILLVNVLQQYLPGGEWAGSMILAVQLVVGVLTILLAKLVLVKVGVKGIK